MRVIKPSRQLLTVWRITLCLIAFVPAVAIFLFLNGLALYISVAVWSLLFLFFFLIYIPLYFKKLLFIIDSDKTTLKQGVIYSSNYTINNKNIQYISIRKSPVFRLFGLVSLIIAVSGAKVTLSGLKQKEARKIMHLLEGEGDAG